MKRPLRAIVPNREDFRDIDPYSQLTFIEKCAFKHIVYVTYAICLKAHLSLKVS